MKARAKTAILAVVAVGSLAAVFAQSTQQQRQDAGIEQGRRLYAENCASCHGVNLEGQPDWMTRKPDGRLPAPPHDETGHTWHHSDQQLFTIIKFGLQAISPGYATDMPKFGDVLSDEEIKSVLAYIKSTWPERARNYQQARSAAER